MPRKRLLAVLSLSALLVVVAALSFAARGASSTATALISGGDPDLLVPSANMPLSANWQAKPANGAAVSLPFANIRVNTDNTQEAQNEPFVAVDPRNSQHMVVGANNWQRGDGHFEVYAYTTFDGGKTWSASQPYINRNASRINAADPTVAFGSNGEVYFAFVAMSPADGAVAVSTSLDGGRTWASQNWATSFTSGADKPSVAVSGGRIYLYYQSGALFGSVSTNGGSTWSAATVIDAAGRNAAPVVDSKGAVNVFYATSSSIKLARSINLGVSYRITNVSDVTALQPRAAHYRASIYPAAGADSRGNLYVAWADGRNAGRGNDILYTRSVNSGTSWSAPVTLNSDNSSADQLMPALSVGSDGAVNVAWLDNRNDSANINYDVYMSRSVDGVHFNGNQRVTSTSSNPSNDPRTQGAMIGDYFAMGAGNTVNVFWTDTRNNNEDIYMAPISINN